MTVTALSALVVCAGAVYLGCSLSHVPGDDAGAADRDSAPPLDSSAGPPAQDGNVSDARASEPRLSDGSTADRYPDVPGWHRPPGMPAHCNVWIADDPTEVAGPFDWEPCFDGRDGCQQLVVDWGGRQEPETFVPPEIDVVGAHRNGEGLFRFGRPAPPSGPPAPDETVVFRESGEAVLAVRDPPQEGPNVECRLIEVDFTADEVVLDIAANASLDRELRDLLYRDTFRAMARSTPRPTRVTREHLPRGFMQADSVGRGAYAAELVGPPALLVLRHGHLQVLPDPDGLTIRDPRIANETVFFQRNLRPDGFAIGIVPPGGTPEPFIDSEQFDALTPAADGEHLIWMQGYGRSSVSIYERVELWTSPMVTGRAELQPRKLADLGDGPPALASTMVGGGWAAAVVPGTASRELRLIRFRDGAQWEITAPEPAEHFIVPAYVSEHELGLYVHWWHQSSGFSKGRTIFRIDLRELGPPMNE